MNIQSKIYTYRTQHLQIEYSYMQPTELGQYGKQSITSISQLTEANECLYII